MYSIVLLQHLYVMISGSGLAQDFVHPGQCMLTSGMLYAGTLPIGWANMSYLRTLCLTRNSLTGDIPSWSSAHALYGSLCEAFASGGVSSARTSLAAIKQQ